MGTRRKELKYGGGRGGLFRQSVRGHGRRLVPRMECRLCEVDAVHCRWCTRCHCPNCGAGTRDGKCVGCQRPTTDKG